MLRIRFIYASVATGFIIIVYVCSTIYYGYASYEVYVSNIFFLVSANMIGMFASYWLEYYMKAVFWKEHLLRIKTKELHKEHKRKSKELKDAIKMQLRMLPDFDEYEFAFSMKAASEVGGDYYDYHLDEFGNLTFGIGDASGRGLKADIMVTAMKLIFTEDAGKSELVQFLKRASRSVHLMKFKHLYMAFAVGRLYDDNWLELAGAGMPTAIIYRNNNRKIEEIPLKGMPLGTSVEYPYQKAVIKINPGDIVLLMTDGLSESFNVKKDVWLPTYSKITDRDV